MAQPVWQQAFSKEDFLALKKNSAIWIWQKQEEKNWKTIPQDTLIKKNLSKQTSFLTERLYIWQKLRGVIMECRGSFFSWRLDYSSSEIWGSGVVLQ